MGPLPIEIVEWTQEWMRLFDEETARMSARTKSLVFHHVGSTSVPGCASKPVVDIMGVVASCNDYIPDHRLLVCEFGYESLGEYGIPGRDFLFRYAEANYHISVFMSGDQNVVNNLKFRDRLIENSVLRERYVALKREFAAAYPDDYSKYNELKAGVIADILAD